jgi:hypothetical protein
MFTKTVLLAALFSATLARAEMDKATIDSLMKQRGYPNSNWPYFENVNGCSGGAPNTLFGNKVVFRTGCDNHDRCYMTLATGVNAQTILSGLSTNLGPNSPAKIKCDGTFYQDLIFACKKGLSGFYNILLPTCLPMASTYAEAVLSAAFPAWQRSQTEQARYQQSFDQMKRDHQAAIGGLMFMLQDDVSIDNFDLPDPFDW